MSRASLVMLRRALQDAREEVQEAEERLSRAQSELEGARYDWEQWEGAAEGSRSPRMRSGKRATDWARPKVSSSWEVLLQRKGQRLRAAGRSAVVRSSWVGARVGLAEARPPSENNGESRCFRHSGGVVGFPAWGRRRKAGTAARSGRDAQNHRAPTQVLRTVSRFARSSERSSSRVWFLGAAPERNPTPPTRSEAETAPAVSRAGGVCVRKPTLPLSRLAEADLIPAA